MDTGDSVRRTGKRLEVDEFAERPRQRTDTLAVLGPTVQCPPLMKPLCLCFSCCCSTAAAFMNATNNTVVAQLDRLRGDLDLFPPQSFPMGHLLKC